LQLQWLAKCRSFEVANLWQNRGNPRRGELDVRDWVEEALLPFDRWDISLVVIRRDIVRNKVPAASTVAQLSATRRAKVFWTGRSQAIRLPKEFRFAGEEVTISRLGSQVIIEAVEVERDAKGWPITFWQLAGAAPEFEVGERPLQHERDDVLNDPAR
jgi:virulence-associated protein VagC